MNAFFRDKSELKTPRTIATFRAILSLVPRKSRLLYGPQSLFYMLILIISRANVSSCEAEYNF